MPGTLNEELIYVTYKVISDLGGQGGERYPEENQSAISFGMGSTQTNQPLTKEKVAIELNHTYIEIIWRTTTGEYEEKVELSVE